MQIHGFIDGELYETRIANGLWICPNCGNAFDTRFVHRCSDYPFIPYHLKWKVVQEHPLADTERKLQHLNGELVTFGY